MGPSGSGGFFSSGPGGGSGSNNVPLQFGWSVAVSADTRVLAVGSPGDQQGTGSVYVYGLDLNEMMWKNFGKALSGSVVGDAFGSSLALSSDKGQTLAVGAWNVGERAGEVRVYEYIEGHWYDKGQPLVGQERAGDVFGSVVALSANGNIVAASAASGDVTSIPDDCRGANAGLVQVFEFDINEKQWNQLGQTLTGDVSYNRFGYSIALSANGKILAVGVPYSDKFGDVSAWAGLVKVYKHDNGTNAWRSLGQILRPKDSHDRFGWSVDLSHDGTVLAVGAPLNDDNGEASGQLRVFQYQHSTNRWEPMGNVIQGQDLGRWFANSVMLSEDGLMVAASLWGDAFWRDKMQYGGVRAYRFEGSQWQQIGQDLPGQTLYDPNSSTVTMSAGGNIVMSGWNDESDSGVVRAYYAG